MAPVDKKPIKKSVTLPKKEVSPKKALRKVVTQAKSKSKSPVKAERKRDVKATQKAELKL